MIKRIQFKGFPLGKLNLLEGYEIPKAGLQTADNIDITDTGKVKRRDGITSLYAGNISSVQQVGKYTLFVEDGDLKYLQSDNTAITVKSSIGTADIDYIEHGGAAYWSNGTVSGKIVNGVSREWGVETPTFIPLATASTGSLPAGKYYYTITYANEYGEEGGIGEVSSITLTEDGGISLYSFPVAVNSETTAVNIYLTDAGGEVLYFVDSVGNEVTTYHITSNALSAPIDSFGMDKPIAANKLAKYSGRLILAQGNTVYGTEAYRPGLVDYSKNYYPFPDEIRLIAGVEDDLMNPGTGGIYVCTEHATYFISSPFTEQATSNKILDYGAPAGYAIRIPNQPSIVSWMSNKGIVIGGPGGRAENMNLAIHYAKTR